MKYEYYYKLTNTTNEVKVSRKELTNLLNQWCTKPIYTINGLGTVDITDEKKVRHTLRAITNGRCRGVIFSQGIVYAEKIEAN